MIGSDMGNRERKRDCVLPLGESAKLKKISTETIHRIVVELNR